jgi:Domain of unknown function (DUF4428)
MSQYELVMKICAVCNQEIGLWAKLTHSDLQVCKNCHQQGQRQLSVLVNSVNATQSFKKEFAERWLNQFGDTVRRYKIPEDEARPLRESLLSGIFRQVETQEEMVEADLKFLADVGQTYSLGQTKSPELQDTIFRVGMREIIQSWERGEVPTRQCGGLVLQRDEICHWEEGAGLLVQKIKHQCVGGQSSVSFRVVKGVRLKVGGFRGRRLDETVLESGGTGVLHITSHRVCFTGQQQAVSIPYKQMIGVIGYEGRFVVQTSNEKKPGIFIVRHPEFTTQFLTLASNPPAEEEKAPRKRKQRLPSSV